MAGAWYVGRATWHRRWRGLLFLGVLAGVVGGAVLGAVAGARRTDSAYERLSTAIDNPNELLFVAGHVPQVEHWLQQRPDVARTQRAAGMIGRRAPEQDWYSLYAPIGRESLRSPVLERGRLPDPDRADEAYVSVRTAANTGLGLGDELTFHAYARDQVTQIIDNPWTPPNGIEVKLRIVGVVRDPTDAQLSPTTKVVFGTPALARASGKGAATTLVGVWLRGGRASEARFERDLSELGRGFPDGSESINFQSTRSDADAAGHSARAVVTGLLIFALVAGIAGLTTVMQTVRRHLTRNNDDGRTLVALGATHADRSSTQLVASLPYLVVAAVVSVAVAYSVSGAFPLGTARTLEPHPGLRGDVLVLSLGTLAWLLLLTGATAAAAWLATATPRHDATRARPARVRTGGGSGGAALPATIGMQYALWSSGRQRALQRTTRTGIVIAFAGVVGCALFFASLHHFTATRTRFGLDYDYTLELPNDHARTVVDQLARDRSLDAAASVQSGTIEVDGHAVEAYAVASASGAIEPVLHSGRRPASATEIALGPKLIDALGKHVGDTVRVTSATGRRTLQIVGTAYVPLPESSEFNGGALLTPAGYDANAAPEAVQAVVRVAPGADRGAVLAHLDREYPYGVSDESLPTPPGAVRNLQQISRLPLALLTFFALLGAAALLQALFLTATERRRDLAVLRALGFTRAQSGTVICSAATGIAVVAALIAIPVGVIAGRIGWTAVTRSLFVAPGVVVPIWGLLVAAAALVVVANVAAVYPVRALTRRTPGAALRAE